jgi:hypothetical protein
MHLQANNLAASSRHIISSYRVEWLLLIKIKIFNVSDICMDNKDRNQLEMEKKRSNSHIRAGKELDKILSKQRQRFSLLSAKHLSRRVNPKSQMLGIFKKVS